MTRALALAVAVVLVPACSEEEPTPSADLGLACRQVVEADALVRWVQAYTSGSNRPSNSFEWVAMRSAALSLEEDLATAVQNLRDTQNRRMANVLAAVQESTSNLATTLRLLDTPESESHIPDVQRAATTVWDAIGDWNSFTNERETSCTDFLPPDDLVDS